LLLAHFRRIESQLIGDLVHLDFLGPSRLGGAVTALGTAGCLVGEDSNRFEAVVRQRVSRGLKNARVKSARNTVPAIGTAVQYRAMMHGGNRSVFFVPRLG